ncbi:unnamed protein product [Candidula unifasciata]|uniref:Uncharacterized protein n=1 Tax=Candidula unifasciata TaxID=100452 RepID=A0A8S4A302_9EUPU|nr:unnamed protein product [Candidula unifasciata]
MKHKSQTLLELKLKELDRLKSEALAHMRRLNVLKVHYMDWFDRRHKTFIEALQYIDFKFPQCLSLNATTIGNFRTGYKAAKALSQREVSLEKCASLLEDYLGFWDRLVELNKQGQCVHKKICDYRDGVAEMKDPQLNDMVHHLQQRLNIELRDDFNFTSVQGTSSDLFAYRVALQDPQYQKLVAFIPHLLRTSTQILCNKMSLEKE